MLPRTGDVETGELRSGVGDLPDMVTASAEALLPTQGTLAGIHQVAKELPASGGLIAAQPLCPSHTATPQSVIKPP